MPEPPPTDEWLRSLPEQRQMEMLGRRYPAWKSGEMRFSETAAEWFHRQPEAAQRAQLGPGKFEAFKAGRFKFEALSMPTTDPVWGIMRVETPLKMLIGEDAE